MTEYLDAFANGEFATEQALGVAAVFRAREMNADTPAALEVKYGDTLLPAPNELQSMQDFVAETILTLQDHGDAYWRISPTGDLTVIPDSAVTVEWNDAKTRRLYLYGTDKVALRETGLTPNLKVVSVNRAAGDLTGMGWLESDRIAGLIAEQKYSQEYFENNGNPTGVLTTPSVLDKGEAEKLKAQWVDARTVRTPAVLSGGMKWDGTSFSATDSDWVETHQAGVLDVAALSGVPAHFLAASPGGSSLTYSSLSDIYEGYWRMTLYPGYVSRIERALTAIYGRQVKFDPEPLFLASMKERVWSATELVRSGFDPAAAVDEVGLPPIGHTGEVPVTLQPDRTAP